ncbi:MAG: type II secretion system protein GspG [Planctomycetota bacterium]|jgi:type II secretory pathway pseudopilin PulG
MDEPAFDSTETDEHELNEYEGSNAAFRVLGRLILAILISVLATLTAYTVQFFRLTQMYEEYLSAPVNQFRNASFALKYYDGIRSRKEFASEEFAPLHTYAERARETKGPMPAVIPSGLKDKFAEVAGKAGRYFSIAFFKAILNDVKNTSRRDALIIGGIVLVILLLVLLATKVWTYLFTRVLKLILIVGVIAWLVTLGLYLWPKKAERQEAHEVSLARLEITMLDIALREYQLDKGTYPPPGNKSLVNHLGRAGMPGKAEHAYFDFNVATLRNGMILDPWGSPYCYGSVGTSSGFELYSVGPNRNDERGNGDDVKIPLPSFGCSTCPVSPSSS